VLRSPARSVLSSHQKNGSRGSGTAGRFNDPRWRYIDPKLLTADLMIYGPQAARQLVSAFIPRCHSSSLCDTIG
jgi:hypothetical protein